MSVSEADIAGALELFDALGDLTTRKMMGGLCLYHNGTIFALLHSDGQVYLKAQSPDMIAKLETMGGVRWTYQREGRDKPTGMPYWSLPDAALDDADLACDLARETLTTLA